MVNQPPDMQNEPDREKLKRELLEEIDNALSETGYTHQTLTKAMQQQQLYPTINSMFSGFLHEINNSDHPEDTQSALVHEILPAACAAIRAHAVFLLEANDPEDPEVLQITGLHLDEENPSQVSQDFLGKPYFIAEEKWRSFGLGKGVEIRRYNPDETATLEVDERLESRHRGEYVLPMPDNVAEVAILRVGNFDSVAKMVLVFHKNWSEKDRDSTRFSNLDDIFDMFMQHLRDLREQADHRRKEIQFNDERTEFMQDVLHQIRGSVSSLSAHVRYLRQANLEDVDLLSELNRLYRSIRVLRDSAESSYLATEKRNIFEVYEEPESIFRGEDWIELLQEYADIFLGEARSRGLQGPIVAEKDLHDLPPVSIRLNLVELIIFNLIQNAVKYSVTGGAIVIDGGLRQDHVEIRVTNNGPGPTVDEESQLFQRHFRSKIVKKMIPIGTGIGLYLCKKIMEEHNGTIDFQTRSIAPDVPSIKQVNVVLRFPVHQGEIVDSSVGFSAPSKAPRIPAVRRTTLGEKPTILYVEDEYYNNEYLIKLLELHFNVIHVFSGVHALQELDADYGGSGKQKIKLVLLDIRLQRGVYQDPRFTGELGGIELARAILHERQYPLNVIAYTGNLVKPMQEQLRELGVVASVLRGKGRESEDELIDLIWEHMPD